MCDCLGNVMTLIIVISTAIGSTHCLGVITMPLFGQNIAVTSAAQLGCVSTMIHETQLVATHIIYAIAFHLTHDVRGWHASAVRPPHMITGT